jgi:6-phosphofructokinase 1
LAGGAESIIVPEVEFNINQVCNKLVKGRNRGKLHSIILLAEGVGGAMELGSQIKELTGIDTRVTILGHLQRGGSPTFFDRLLASKMGARAVDLLLEGKSGLALGSKGMSLIEVDYNEVFNLEKPFDKDTYDLANILSI